MEQHLTPSKPSLGFQLSVKINQGTGERFFLTYHLTTVNRGQNSDSDLFFFVALRVLVIWKADVTKGERDS